VMMFKLCSVWRLLNWVRALELLSCLVLAESFPALQNHNNPPLFHHCYQLSFLVSKLDSSGLVWCSCKSIKTRVRNTALMERDPDFKASQVI
jgi:hypothetical protein